MSNDSEIVPYTLPFKQRSRFRWSENFKYVFLVILFGGFLLLPVDGDIKVVLLKFFSAAMLVFILANWVYIGVLKWAYLEATEEYFAYKTILGIKKVKWSEIADIQIFSISNNKFVGIMLKKSLEKSKQSFWNELADMQGSRFSIRIATAAFYGMNIERFYLTIFEKLKQEYQDCEQLNEKDIVESQSEKQEVDIKSSNLIVALLKSLGLSVLMGIIYGLSIYFLDINILIIPVLTSLGILYVYQKSYEKEPANLVMRLILGIICAVPAYIAPITVILFESEVGISLGNIVQISIAYIEYLINNPIKNIMILIIAVTCFGIGAVQGHTFKFEKVYEKLFMKKTGKYYIKRDQHITSIYLVDPVEFDEYKEGNLVFSLLQGCYIEKHRKRVLAFYIPRDYLDEEDIELNCDEIIEIQGKKYHKIDIASKGNYQTYVYSCIMFLNNQRQVELMRVEV